VDTPFDREFSSLNASQQEAVLHKDGPLLVIAGAGSGKTRVATMRVAHLVRSGVTADSIVGVTFTNKAAKEMRHRVDQLVGSEVLVSTFHSLGARILREFIPHLGFPATFSIYDEDESGKVIKGCLKDMARQDKEASVAHARMLISKIKGAPGILEQMDMPTRCLFEEYQRRLKQSGAVDFDDLIYLPIILFRQCPQVLDMCCQRWKYLLVDEYQDTSDSQSQFAAALAGRLMNIFAVGDPDQAIYSWRGAKVSNILAFSEKFPNAKVVRLEQNYRSTNTILFASNAVIQCNENRYDKKLWSQRGRGEPILQFHARTERQEAEFVLNHIASLIRKGSSYDHMAILYRTNAQSRQFEESLLSAHIPYQIWGGIPFYSRKEIRDVVCLLQIAAVPTDVVAFERAISVLTSGIGEVTLSKIRTVALQESKPIFEVAQESSAFTKKQKAAIDEFFRVIHMLRQKIEEGSTSEAVYSAIYETGYLGSLEKDPETAVDRRENLEQLSRRAQEWEEENPGTSPLIFLGELVLEGAREQSNSPGPKITLTTVHNAKGLEFPCVFLVGLEEDVFPHINAKKDGEDVEEERRLFYVGMTRAKDRLFISASQTRYLFGELRLMRTSRFLHELPEEFVQVASSAYSKTSLW
jgi:DNA helicase-2/ATP-dependent DNA helicase PcrA